MPEEAGAPAPSSRALWSGSISFGLVSVPVELYSGARPAGPSLRMLGPEGRPLVRQYVCPADGRVLSPEEIERGAEVGEGAFVVVRDEELEELAPRRSREIALERFVPREELDPAFFVRPYFLVPGGEQTRAYRLLADAMEAKGRVGIARFVMRGHAYAVALLAERGVLRAETLRFGDELRTPRTLGLPEPGEVDEARVEAMAERIEALTAEDLDPAELSDEAAQRLVARAEAKVSRGEAVVEVGQEEAGAEAEEPGGRVLDLVALLKERMRSEGGEAGGEERAAGARKAPRRKRGGAKGRASEAGEAGDGDALEDASKRELYERARELGVPGRSRMTRAQLLESLRRAG